MSSTNISEQTQPAIDSAPPNEANRGNRHACERCRKSKVRCLVDTVEKHGKCRRCFEAGAECVFAAIAPRQRRKRTDARVTSLEKKLNEMRSMFDNLKAEQETPKFERQSPEQGNASTNKHSLDEHYRSSSNSFTPPTLAPNLTPRSSSYHESDEHPHSVYDSPSNSISEIFTSCNISRTEAARLFSRFVTDLLPLYPVAKIDQEITFDSICSTKPTFTFAAVTAATCSESPEIFGNMHARLLRLLAEKVVIEGEKSLELLQALLIMETWYCPPDDLKKLNFYQWIHISGTMALQLGIGGRLLRTEEDKTLQTTNAPVSDAQLEAWRTMFTVYIACSSVAISLHRQKMISFTPVAEARLVKFEKVATSINDKRLAAMVRLQHIADDVESEKVAADATSEQASTTQTALQNRLRVLQKRFKSWESGLEEGVMSGPLKVQLHFWEGKLFERLMHADSDLEQLVPPLVAQAPPTSPPNSPPTDLNPGYIRAVLGFVSACHATLDAMLAIQPIELRSCPTVILIRTVHAMKALMMLERAVRQPNNEIGKVVDSDSLRLQHYSQLLDGHLAAASGQSKCRVPALVRDVVQKITGFLRSHRDDDDITLNPDSGKHHNLEVGSVVPVGMPTFQPEHTTAKISIGGSNPSEVFQADPSVSFNVHPAGSTTGERHGTSEHFGSERLIPSLDPYMFYHNAQYNQWEPTDDFDLMMMSDISFTNTNTMDYSGQFFGEQMNPSTFDESWTTNAPHSSAWTPHR